MRSRGSRCPSSLAPFKRYAASGEINTEVADPAGDGRAASPRRSRDRRRRRRHARRARRVDHGDWWFNLRPSNTEPLLRLNVEAPDDDACAAHVTEVLDMIEGGVTMALDGFLLDLLEDPVDHGPLLYVERRTCSTTRVAASPTRSAIRSRCCCPTSRDR